MRRWMNNATLKQIKNKLAKEHVCYVLITCEKASEDGNLQVEMCYEGDATLASYLLHGAQLIIDEQEELSDNTSHQSKVLTFNR
jgi:hypothetical protein